MKPKFQLKVKVWPEEDSDSSEEDSLPNLSSPATPGSSAPATPASNRSSMSKTARHLSLSHEKIHAKKIQEKRHEIEMAVQYCRDNSCKGYRAIAELDLQHVKDPRTINQHLSGKVRTGNEKAHQQILTTVEEKTLVKYLINRNRACQGLTDTQVEGIVLNMLRVRRDRNRKGGRNFERLSKNAKDALERKHIGKSFFRRLKTRYSKLKQKRQTLVSAKRGLRCTLEMAISYLDDLADHLIEVGIAPDLVKKAPGVWIGKVDLKRIWAHDETPQFINFGTTGASKSKIYAGSGHDCNEITKENRENVTIQPFSNFAGDLAMCQVIFSGSGLTSHMCPKNAAEKIENLIITVNDTGCSTGETLLAAYSELTKVVKMRKEAREGTAEVEDSIDIVIADGHKSRFNPQVMEHCDNNSLEQHILPPDTSGVTQKHDQINQQLHSKYSSKKKEMYTSYSDLNKECFMNILAEIWNEWATPERIEKAGKRVGISKDGLNVNWMDQSKFEQAEAILSPPTPTKTFDSLPQVKTPEGVRRYSAKYWESLYLQRTEQVQACAEEDFQLETVPGLLPFKKVRPTETKRRKITDVHGSLKATDVRTLIEQREAEEKKKEERKEEIRLQKEETKLKFERCLAACICKAKVCEAIHLLKCCVCKNVQKSQCTKKACKQDGEAPIMIQVAAKKEKGKGLNRKKKGEDYESGESDEDISDMESERDETDDTDEEDRVMKATSSSSRSSRASIQKASGWTAIKAVQESLDDDQNGKFFAVYFDKMFYWGKSLRVS